MASDRNQAWKYWAAGIVVVLVIVGGVVGLLLPSQGSPTPTANPTATSPAASEPGADGCGMPENDSREAPADLEWVSAQGVSWPNSPTLGPAAASASGLPVCFAHSPVGAALAATSIMFAQVEHGAEPVMEFYSTESPGRAALLDAAEASDSAGTSFADSVRASGINVEGFQISEYTPERAGVRLIFNSPTTDTGYTAIELTLVWVDGDWRLKPKDDGTAAWPAANPRAGTFIEWSSRG